MEEENNAITSSFDNLKCELETDSTMNIFEVIETHLKLDENIKSWDNDKWNYIFDILQRNLKKFSTDRETLKKTIKFINTLLVFLPFSTFHACCRALNVMLEIIIFKLNNQDPKECVELNKNEIKRLFLAVISILNHLKAFGLKTTSHIKQLGKVISLLCDVLSEKNAFIDIKTMLEMWKTVSGLLKLFAAQARNQGLEFIEQYKTVMTKPLLFLLHKIDHSIDLIYKVEVLQQSPEQIDKYLRVTSFYLKILRQLITEFKQSDSSAIQQFFTTYTKAKFPPKHLDGSKIKELLDVHILNDMNELFTHVYQHPDFSKLIHSFMIENSACRSNVLVASYLNTIIIHKDKEFINNNLESFSRIFEAAFKGSEINDREMYDEIIELYSALILLAENIEFLKYFRENVLKSNFWIASASADVLSMLLRYQCKYLDYPEPYLLQEFCFWCECNDTFAVFSSDARHSNIKYLLKNCFTICKSTNSTLIPNIFGTTSEVFLKAEHYKLALVIGLEDFCVNEQALRGVHKCISGELLELLSQFNAGKSTIDNYYRILVYMKLLETCILPLRKELMEVLTNTTLFILDSENRLKQDFVLFISAIYSLSATFVENMESQFLEKLLNHFKRNDMLHSSPESLRFLSACSKSTFPKLKQQAIFILRSHGVEISGDINVKFELDILKRLQFESEGCKNCDGHVYNVEPYSKRQCFDFRK